MHTLQESVLPEIGLGGAGAHPSVAKHFQKESQQALTQDTQVAGSMTATANAGDGAPTTASSPIAAQMGGGAYHPAVAKHLQNR